MAKLTQIGEQEAKEWLHTYADMDAADIWQSLETAKGPHTMKDHCEAILKLYPELDNYKDGSIDEVKRLCAENLGLSLRNTRRAAKFIRDITVQQKKLMKAPALMSNREIVTYVLRTLDQDSESAVVNRLALKVRLDSLQANPVPAVVDRRKGDLYKIEDVFSVIWEIINSQPPISQSSSSEEFSREDKPAGATPAITVKAEPVISDGLERTMASLADSMTNLLKQNQALYTEQREDRKTRSEELRALGESFQSSLQTLGHNLAEAPRSTFTKAAPSGAPPFRTDMRCWFCSGTGHGAQHCSARNTMIQNGTIKEKEGRIYFPDGRPVPFGGGNKSQKELIEESLASSNYNGSYAMPAPPEHQYYSNSAVLDHMIEENKYLREQNTNFHKTFTYFQDPNGRPNVSTNGGNTRFEQQGSYYNSPSGSSSSYQPGNSGEPRPPSKDEMREYIQGLLFPEGVSNAAPGSSGN